MATRKTTSLPVTEKTVCETNADQNRTPIDRVIIHTMVGTQASADHRFNDCNSKVSAHYGVGLDGSIWHWVDEDWVAYHAEDYAMNQRSIGIEHEDNGLYNDPRPDSLYVTSSKLVADICKFYSIPCDRTHILKHSEVSDNPTGCPDALDIDRIVHEALQILNPIVLNPQPVITDQTKYDFGTPYGILEMQAVKSQLQAKDRRIDSLFSLSDDMNKEILNLQTQLTDLLKQQPDCQNKPIIASPYGNMNVPTPNPIDRLWGWFLHLIGR